jgi:6-pyruvoyl-tetrahydropterin synthase
MLIKKEYKAYMSHRNQELTGTKCSRPHGHQYKIFCFFNVKRNGNITTLFEEFDKKVEVMLKDEFDHRMIVDKNDPLTTTLLYHQNECKDDLGLKVLPFPTSVENLCFFLFDEIVTRFIFDLVRLEIQETMSSTIIYTEDDYAADIIHFGSQVKEHSL